MRGCPQRIVDLPIARDIRMGGNRTMEFRLDVFNALDTVVFENRNASIQFNNPASMTVLNFFLLLSSTVNLQPARRARTVPCVGMFATLCMPTAMGLRAHACATRGTPAHPPCP